MTCTVGRLGRLVPEILAINLLATLLKFGWVTYVGACKPHAVVENQVGKTLVD